MICDLAETYHIFDYRSMPVNLLAILVVGLRDNSRVKMKLSGSKLDLQSTILAAVLDGIRALVWLNSADGSKGRNRPESVLEKLTTDKSERHSDAFESTEAFQAARRRIIERRGTNGS